MGKCHLSNLNWPYKDDFHMEGKFWSYNHSQNI